MSQRLHDPQVHTSEPKTILIGLHNSKVLTGGGVTVHQGPIDRQL